MGLIKDGTITGIIPDRRHFAVYYPGYPSSIARAVETLGGEDGLSKARASESGFLELRFRPEDPFCHPAFGELHSTPSLLLHLSNRCSHGTRPGSSSSLHSEMDAVRRNRSMESDGARSGEFNNEEAGSEGCGGELSRKGGGNAELSKEDLRNKPCTVELGSKETRREELSSKEARNGHHSKDLIYGAAGTACSSAEWINKETEASELDKDMENERHSEELSSKETGNVESSNKETGNGWCRDLSDKAIGSGQCSSESTNKETGVGLCSAELSADIVARIEQSYDFNGMVDYQYVVPVHADQLGNKRRRLLDQSYEKRGVMEMDEEEIMLLVPPLFSLKDMPDNVVLRSTEISRASQRLSDQPCVEASIVPCFNLDFNVKEVPSKINWEEKLAKGSSDWHLQVAVSKLFDERPIWAKPALNDMLVEQGIQLSDFNLRRVLFRTSYYFSQGPFRSLWIKNGYDPRKDSESRRFQMIDFRVPFPLKVTADKYFKQQQRQREKVAWKDICSFKAVASKMFLYLQLFDLEDSYIQDQIRRPAERITCSKYTGWFHRSTIERLRLQLRIRFISLIPGQLARSLEILESKKLERLKHLEGTCDDQADDEPDKELEDDVRKLNESEVNGEDDEEEEEESYYQATLQEAGFPHLSGSRESYLDPSDSVPQNYLQELLGKFSYSATDGINNSGDFSQLDDDAEYEIFDQDIDYDSDD